MTQQEWRDLADELERLIADFDRFQTLEWARATVDRIRMLVDQIRSEFEGN